MTFEKRYLQAWYDEWLAEYRTSKINRYLLSRSQLEELSKSVERMTPTPWTVGEVNYTATVHAPLVRYDGKVMEADPPELVSDVVIPFGRAYSDAAGIVALRNSFASIFDHINRLESELDKALAPSLAQLHFVRDHLAFVVWRDIPYYKIPKEAPPRSDCRESASIVGEHYSKSIRLPVYSFDRPDLGVRITLRENFHDWNMSWESESPIQIALDGFPTKDIEYCFFQGFPEDRKFGPFEHNNRHFSMCVRTDYQLYALIWLLMQEVRRLHYS